MEALYKKLYSKYTTLKTNKLSELEDVHKEQELKFLKFVSAAEDVIDHLRTENDKLLGQINDLGNELTSVRVAKDNELVEHKRLLLEEKKKNEALFEEVEKLQKLLKEGTSGDLSNRKVVNNTSNNSSIRMTRKRMRQEQDALDIEARCIPSENEGNSVDRESTRSFLKENASNKRQECSSSKANDQSGVDTQESDHQNWLVHALFEYTLDMKLSTDCQTGRLCLSAMHQSSGYSFSISWISRAPGEEAELLYHVLSLGTLERLAPEWMREDIMFSPTMCPIFFERVTHVINLKQ
ncbi:hypothetical protein MtrunA17_Chr8g0359191 [Medicago truncatula]|uniref:Titan9, putative n=1 Tax=Medicago truncatula TaxID=3880 RepID=G7LCU1_MEDTR|nr:uncharacterized protein LOC11406266 isoform X3 [Medicago truncatula]AET02966.1 titan9, putative [Medicago truncatula]RHN40830.1 hypothetical protein MtrunA17_Chr8g0359191 [Medicago truncatula]